MTGYFHFMFYFPFTSNKNIFFNKFKPNFIFSLAIPTRTYYFYGY